MWRQALNSLLPILCFLACFAKADYMLFTSEARSSLFAAKLEYIKGTLAVLNVTLISNLDLTPRSNAEFPIA